MNQSPLFGLAKDPNRAEEDPCIKMAFKEINKIRAVAVAQLVEWSLTIPEVHGSNPVIGKRLY